MYLCFRRRKKFKALHIAKARLSKWNGYMSFMERGLVKN